MLKFVMVLTLSACLAAPAAAQEAPPAAPGAEAAEISARMQDDLSRLLEQLVGKDKSRAFVTVDGEAVLKTRKESGTPPESVITLPGYASVNVLEKTGEYIKQQKEETQHTTEFRIKKISVSIVFDKSVPDVQANAVKLLTSDILRLSEPRGDSIIIARADMLPWWKTLLNSTDNRRFLLMSALTALVLLLVVLAAYLLGGKLVSDFFDYARVNAMASQPLPSGGVGGGAGAGGAEGPGGEFPEIIDVEASAAGGGLLTAQSAFDFMEKLLPEETAELLSGETEGDAAVVIANMSDKKPHISSKILMAFEPARRQAVTAAMLALKEVEPERVMEIENNLRNRLEKSLKGAEKLGRLLSLVDVGERDEIMDNLARVDAAGAGKLKNALVTFDDICRLDDKNLRPLVISLPYRDWASALQGAPENAVSNVVKLFPNDIRLIIKDLLLTPLEKELVINSRARIISAAVELGRKGKIDLKAGS